MASNRRGGRHRVEPQAFEGEARRKDGELFCPVRVRAGAPAHEPVVNVEPVEVAS